MERLLIAAVLAGVVGGIALALRRLRPPRSVTMASGPEGWALPQQIAWADLGEPDADVAVVVFTSATCETCARVWEQAQRLARAGVIVRELEYGTARAFHQRYGIEGVPATAFVRPDGGVQTWLLGPVQDEQLAHGLDLALDAGRGVEVRRPSSDEPRT